jgi:hypothetical protein
MGVCIDDLGLNAGITAAAQDLIDRRRASAIACMVGGPAWPQAAAWLRRLDRETAELGLHLDLTDHPLQAAMRRSLPQWLLAAACGSIDRVALRREIDAQLSAFAAAIGRVPDFIDGHRHVHQLRGVRDEATAAFAAAHASIAASAPRRPARQAWVRCGVAPAVLRVAQGGFALGPELPHLKAWLLQAIGGRALAAQARGCGLAHNAHLLGVYGFDRDIAGYLKLLGVWLAAATHGDLLMVHPGESAPGDPLQHVRPLEWQALAGAEFGVLMEARGITIGPLGTILGT